MCREEAAMNALLPAVLLRGCVGYPDIRAITRHLDDLYGASVGTLVRRVGDWQTTGLYCSFIEDRFAMPGDAVLAPMADFLRQLMRMPVTENGVFSSDYIESEKKIRHVHTVESHGTTLDILLGGTIDRIDSKQNESGHKVTRIIDYKTGGSKKTIKSIDELFHRDKPRDGYVFQAFYYAYLMSSEYERIAPSLLFVRNTSDEAFEPHILIDKHPVEDFSIYRDTFAQLLHETINEIFNSDVPYTATTNKEACKYCKFTSLCGKVISS
jgi:CRISPR/Cas system-associated exonuclease Cas4 (RecB family)